MMTWVILNILNSLSFLVAKRKFMDWLIGPKRSENIENIRSLFAITGVKNLSYDYIRVYKKKKKQMSTAHLR